MCGVIGIITPACQDETVLSSHAESSYAAHEVYRGLLTLQHRGQDAAGISVFDPFRKRIHGHRQLGLVTDVFTKNILDSLKGTMAVGHTRYATTGSDSADDLQPQMTGFPTGMAVAHNGNIVNYHSLIEHLQSDHGIQNLTGNDIELFLHYFGLSLSKKQDLKSLNYNTIREAADLVQDKVIGAYSFVGLFSSGGLLAMRDPDGIRPLLLGKKEEQGIITYCVCSEAVALNFLGFELVRDVYPGEILYIDQKGELHTNRSPDALLSKKPCMFEWVYFSGAESVVAKKSIYATRLNLGTVLADEIKAKNGWQADIVVPVPDTSRTAAISLAEELGLPYREALIKNRYTHRSFILSGQEKREKAVELKLSPIISEIRGKKILLVDDSVVRGTTSKKIIKLLKKYGAKEVSLAITCPPLRSACYYGIDFPSSDQLVANQKNNEEIAEYLGATKVYYLSNEGLKKAIGLPEMCMACVDGKYPTSVSEGEVFARKREEQRGMS